MKRLPKFAIGELVRLVETDSPELSCSCTEVLDSKWMDKTRKLDGSYGKPGWKYRLDCHPNLTSNPKKPAWFDESKLRKIDRPRDSAVDFLKRQFKNFTPEKPKEPVSNDT